jgi:hypothetical protein
MHGLQQEFEAAILQSDILGMPLVSRLEVDFGQFGYLGALEDRIGRIVRDSPGMLFCDSLVHIALHRISPFYKEILSGLPFLGFIGPHRGLAAQLAVRFDIASHHTYTVPGEMRLPDHAGRNQADRHFPGRFRELMAGIEVPYHGAVFLVAAGLLGKIYCHRIKALGGIAIDIGSVADAWLGYNTRPGQYDNALDWCLRSP